MSRVQQPARDAAGNAGDEATVDEKEPPPWQSLKVVFVEESLPDAEARWHEVLALLLARGRAS
jgi:hypothetical protein